MSSKEVLISTPERNFVLTALKQGLRADGRALIEKRELKITLGKQETGQADIEFGATKISACVSCTIVEPVPERPAEGVLSVSVDFSPLASPSSLFDGGGANALKTENVIIQRTIDRAMRDTRAIDLESLCIIPASKVWSIRCDIHILDHGGNLIDACNIAALASLMHFRRPDVTVSGGTIVALHSLHDREPIALSFHHVPVTTTFHNFHRGTISILDATVREEEISESSVTVIVNSVGELLCSLKFGGVGISSSVFFRLCNLAASNAKEIALALRQKMAEFEADNVIKSVKQGISKIKQTTTA